MECFAKEYVDSFAIRSGFSQDFIDSLMNPASFGSSASEERRTIITVLLYEYLKTDKIDYVESFILMNFLLDGNVDYAANALNRSVNSTENILCNLIVGFEKFGNSLLQCGFVMDIVACKKFVKTLLVFKDNEAFLSKRLCGGLITVKILSSFLSSMNL